MITQYLCEALPIFLIRESSVSILLSLTTWILLIWILVLQILLVIVSCPCLVNELLFGFVLWLWKFFGLLCFTLACF